MSNPAALAPRTKLWNRTADARHQSRTRTPGSSAPRLASFVIEPRGQWPCQGGPQPPPRSRPWA